MSFQQILSPDNYWANLYVNSITLPPSSPIPGITSYYTSALLSRNFALITTGTVNGVAATVVDGKMLTGSTIKVQQAENLVTLFLPEMLATGFTGSTGLATMSYLTDFNPQIPLPTFNSPIVCTYVSSGTTALDFVVLDTSGVITNTGPAVVPFGYKQSIMQYYVDG